jgi:hypothetical protein
MRSLGHCGFPVAVSSISCAITAGLGGFDEGKQIYSPPIHVVPPLPSTKHRTLKPSPPVIRDAYYSHLEFSFERHLVLERLTGACRWDPPMPLGVIAPSGVRYDLQLRLWNGLVFGEYGYFSER